MHKQPGPDASSNAIRWTTLGSDSPEPDARFKAAVPGPQHPRFPNPDTRRRQTRSALPGIILIMAVGLAAAGCERDIQPTVHVKPTAGIRQLPLTVGLHFTDDFRRHVVRERDFGDPNMVWKIDIGTPSAAMFRRVSGRLFSRVRVIRTRRPSLDTARSLAVIIEPKIKDFDPLSFPKRRQYGSTITYQLDFYTPQGQFLSSWEVTGKSLLRQGTITLHSSAYSGAASAAISAAADVILARFHIRPKLQAWLASQMEKRN